MGLPKHLADKVAAAKVSNAKGRLGLGDYELLITKIFFNQGFKGDSFIIEVVVDESKELPERMRLSPVQGEQAGQSPSRFSFPNEGGSEASFVWNFKNSSTEGNIAAFLTALHGGQPLDAASIRRYVDEAIDDDNPARGMRIGCWFGEGVSKKGEYFQSPKFYNLKGNTAPEIAERRKALDTLEQSK